jgi:hypothetical protein
MDEAVRRVNELADLSRRACRNRVESTFSTDRMVERYCDAYVRALDQKLPPPPTAEQQRWRAHDWWDRPMAFTDIPPKPSWR